MYRDKQYSDQILSHRLVPLVPVRINGGKDKHYDFDNAESKISV